MTTFASFRLRSVFAAVVLAGVVGAGALLATDATTGSAAAALSPVSEATAAPALPASLPAAPVSGTLAASVAAVPVAVPPVDAAPAPAEDPMADVIVEPVDPAEALFGDHAAVAVSN